MGGNSIGAKAPEHAYTRTTAAKLVKRSPDTLKRWHKQGICVPSTNMKAGKLTVWLYTEDDLLTLRELAKTQKPGRPPKKKQR
jgi:DNA-binding transcriptional MerR regulator